MNVYEQIVVKIIKSQEAIIGPIAAEQAQRVPHLKVDWKNKEIAIEGDTSKAINSLVQVYKELFGQISVEVSKEAAAPLVSQLPASQLPEALK
jgi:hypothetical protein